jgi:hypothetical protein
MLSQNKIFRLAAWVAVTGLVLGPAMPDRVYAQGAPPPNQGPEVNPPARVGRLAWTQGTVSFHTADSDSWSPAVVNYPVTSGIAFWTQPDAMGGIQVSDVLLAMAGTTELDVNTLDDTNFLATEPQGEVYVHARDLAQGETYTLETPRGTVTIATPGRYEIAAGTTQSPTFVTVLEGAAQVTPGGQGAQPLNVPAGQTATITGDQTFQAQLGPATHDAFLDAMAAREQQAPAQPAAVPPAVAQMPGGADLAEYGSWSQSSQYGDVWYPQVSAGWVPYREGQWSYVQPWGWTWVDSDPWGFAPFHYGRWVDIGGRWGWCPGAAVAGAPAYPVYAPALVSFFGIGAAAAVGVGVGFAIGSLLNGSVGWVPLGWNQPWHPWFNASPSYFRQVNIRNVTNINSIRNTTINNVTINNFPNARAATVVPASAMVTSRPLQGVAQPARPEQLASARPIVGRPPVPPTTATLGVTPALARQEHIAALPAGITAPARPAAPGPAIHPETLAAARPGARPTQPTLRTPAAAGMTAVPHAPAAGVAGVTPGVRPGTAVTPGAPAVAEHAMPALRTPEAGKAGPPPIANEPGRTALAAPRVPPGVTGPETAAQHVVPPQQHLASPVAPRPEEQHGVTHPAPVAARPGAPPVVHEPAHAAVVRPEAPVVHEPVHPAVVRPEAPVVHEPAHPAVAPRVEAPHPAPRPEVHIAAPRPAPEAHPAPASHPAPQHEEKRPGQP